MSTAIGLGILAIALVIVLTFIAWWGIKNSFPGSGDAASIAQSFSELIKTFGQVIIGLFVIVTLTALLFEDRIKSEAAMPVISLVAGYILGSSIEAKFKK